jgi:hypothetical protein
LGRIAEVEARNLIESKIMPRKCQNWLKSFHDWSLPRSEAPATFHTWAGLFTLASILKRKVRVPKSLLGGWEVSPTLYVIFIAPPGKARKSTTANYAEELLTEVPGIKLASTAMTKEVLLHKLSNDNKDASLSILSSEFAMFIQKSGFDMYDVLTDLFDAKKTISVETFKRGLEMADRPCVNLLAATTPDWVAANMPESVIGGGFASRVIFIFEEKKRRSQLFYDNIDHKVLDVKRDDLVEDLIWIDQNVAGDFSIAEDAKEFMEEWYSVNDETPVSNYRLEGYFQRKTAHIFKTAMLLHISHSDNLVLDTDDFQGAITLLEQVERKLPMTFKNIGKNEYVSDLEKMYMYVVKERIVSHQVLFSEFLSVAQPAKLTELIEALIITGKIKMSIDQGVTYYTPII